MPVQVIMPQLGESVNEGTVTKWLKAKGDSVAEYEPLVEVNTDKVDTEIPSPAGGIILDILIPEGTTITAGTLMALIDAIGESAPEAVPQAPQPVPVAAQKPDQPVVSMPGSGQAAGRDRDLGFISPVVAKIASQNQVDLAKVPGTGQAGRITKKDILAYLERRQAEAGRVKVSVAPSPTAAVTPAYTPSIFPDDELLPLTQVRRLIAEHMVYSERTTPHVTTVMEADLSRVVAHRNANKESFAREGINLTFTAYFVSAATSALKAYPLVNSSWSEQGIVLHRPINIGLATSLGAEGLIVPVVKHADGLSLLGLARAIGDLATRARAKKLHPDEVKEGTFTITNHGISDSLFATPIINQPQCAILGVGAIQKRVVVVSDPAQGDAIAIRPMVYLGLTFDHRILDGASADNFLGGVVKALEEW